MPIPTSITDLSSTASLNSPSGAENVSTTDDYLRAVQGIVKTVYDAQATVNATIPAAGAGLGANSFTGNQTVATNAAFRTSVSTLASSATPDIWTNQSNVINYTGTTTATGFAAAPQPGVSCRLILAAASSFTAGANVLIDGYASGTTYLGAVGDEVSITAVTTTQFRLRIKKYDGTPTVTGSKIQSISSSVAANALTLNYGGGSLDFRNPTLSNGSPITLSIAANSITVPSGATLGLPSGIQGRLALLEAYNGGSPVACVSNVAGGLQLDETNLISPTTISVGATSASVIYSASAVSANSSYRVVGYVDITETTAGTWATDATVKQGAGGQALQHINAICNGVAVASTSGNSIDFTGIPSWAKRITVMFNGMSTSGTSIPQVQLGAGSVDTTGYNASAEYGPTGNQIQFLSSGFPISTAGVAAAAAVYYGQIVFNLFGSNIWVAAGNLSVTSTGTVCACAGGKTLSGILDRIRITTVNGTDTFDAGSINIMWE